MEKELFALLRLGLGNSTAEEENLADFIVLSAEQWGRIGDLARKQGVLGIMLDGIERLEVSGERLAGLTRGLSQQMRLEWIGEVLQIEQRNRQQMAVMEEMAGMWKQNGCRVMVMKGHANGTMYPKPEHRNPGDIDCFLLDERRSTKDEGQETAYKIGNEVARAAGAMVDESWYKHSVISYKGETFENHQFFVHTRDGKRGKRLEKELEEELVAGHTDFTDNTDFLPLTANTVMPPVQWTAMFLTYHACAHFVSEGLRLKQILDWVMFLKKYQGDVDWTAFYAFCDRNHLRVFVDAMNTIARRYFNVNVNDNENENENGKDNLDGESPYAEKILHNALYEDDYVFNSGKSGWTNRFHLVRNMFRYRWKYEEVYQTSVWKQLWWYVSGYLFKTE